MKTRTKSFQQLYKERYLSYVHSLPKLKEKKTQAYIMLIFTLLALCFFGMFAIMPTLVTIVDLKKQLADSFYTQDQLTTKIRNLETLKNEYAVMSDDIDTVFRAIPATPNAPLLLAEIQAIAEKNNLTIKSLAASNVPLTRIKPFAKKMPSFTLTLTVLGSYTDIAKFLATLSSFDRIMTFDTLSVVRDLKKPTALSLDITATTYFQP